MVVLQTVLDLNDDDAPSSGAASAGHLGSQPSKLFAEVPCTECKTLMPFLRTETGDLYVSPTAPTPACVER